MKQQLEISTKISTHGERNSTNFYTRQISNTLQFWILLLFGISSLICSLLILYQYALFRKRRRALHNHVILLIIMINVIIILTDFSWMLDSLRRPGHILSATQEFCMTWWFFDFSLYSVQTILLAWASIERHILIFHNNMVSTTKQKIFFHYLPPALIIIYLFSFYAVVIFRPPCHNRFDFKSVECGSNPCFLSIDILAVWESVMRSALPTLIIAVFSIALLYRVIAHKKRLRQPIRWRKHRRMSMQILTISAVYLFLNFPLTIIMLVQLFQDTGAHFGFGTQLYIFFLTYGVVFSLPFVVCINSFSNHKHENQRIAPIVKFPQHQRVFVRNISKVE
ncbi:unnamed protein product [Rotaria magnacalcarata]|uniref:G-protein coupled receptors family 1 profile domain-containing protein n=1 Tax=Rotaria magnacalcarata TaxID=392030 RepID=A0A816S7R9_9BILA|nr:unnamed protein product [Rotaria magnacalcarata]CAF1686345.1 unnamed protein product [Rotaria magnacalcarata]CAF2084566.1 unnamed protein product [Rotaria magnacalcarata]CAF3766865.1 unnamed protein product [Rotaria magnacalcarata]CAF3810500.1 unnamed protein product [Rotaria magnacalcarata]